MISKCECGKEIRQKNGRRKTVCHQCEVERRLKTNGKRQVTAKAIYEYICENTTTAYWIGIEFYRKPKATWEILTKLHRGNYIVWVDDENNIRPVRIEDELELELCHD